MIEIEGFKLTDYRLAKELFEKFYAHGRVGDIEFPNFINNYLCAYTVKDQKGIICVSGVRTIAEVCLITDKNRSVRDRVMALREVLRASSFIAREFRFDWLHAITDDPTWANQMKENGFVSRGEDLEIHVGDIK